MKKSTGPAHIPRLHEVRSDTPAKVEGSYTLPARMQQDPEKKSPARWAYERMVLYIQKFEETLDEEHEVAMGFTGADSGLLRIEGMGYFDPDIITFYGTDPTGQKVQLVQHVTQLEVMLRALPRQVEQPARTRIGFRLAQDLDADLDQPDTA